MKCVLQVSTATNPTHPLRVRRNQWLRPCLGLVASLTLSTAHAAGDEPAPSPSEPRKLELGADLGVEQRSMTRDSVEVSPSLSWTVHANVLLFPWLGIRTEGGMEYLHTTLGQGATGVAGEALGSSMLSGPRVVASLQPSYWLAPRWQLFARAGVGWQRLVSESIEVGQPTPLTISERTGVIVEFPASIGAGYVALPDWLLISADVGVRVAGPQSGALFESGAGANQSLRQDTGELVHVAAFPTFGSGLFARMSVDVVF